MSEVHPAEISDLAFMDPLPLLVSADCAGDILLWAVRPRSSQCQSLLLACVHFFSPIRDYYVSDGSDAGATRH
jgi:hypothetical protein